MTPKSTETCGVVRALSNSSMEAPEIEGLIMSAGQPGHVDVDQIKRCAVALTQHIALGGLRD